MLENNRINHEKFIQCIVSSRKFIDSKITKDLMYTNKNKILIIILSFALLAKKKKFKCFKFYKHQNNINDIGRDGDITFIIHYFMSRLMHSLGGLNQETLTELRIPIGTFFSSVRREIDIIKHQFNSMSKYKIGILTSEKLFIIKLVS